MYFSEKEQLIIEKFYKNISSITEKDVLTLIWDDGEVKAIFDTCFDDFDENNESDEFTSFAFKKLEVVGKPPIKIEKEDFFIINYYNFPGKIICNGKKIN